MSFYLEEKNYVYLVILRDGKVEKIGMSIRVTNFIKNFSDSPSKADYNLRVDNIHFTLIGKGISSIGGGHVCPLHTQNDKVSVDRKVPINGTFQAQEENISIKGAL